MILFYAFLFIVFEAITEALIKQFHPGSFIFKWWVQWIIAIGLFLIWYFLMQGFDKYYVENWKLITGFIFVRFAVFDLVYNITFGNPLFYYGTTKLYDRIMAELGGWGWMAKIICGIMGICFLLGYE